MKVFVATEWSREQLLESWIQDPVACCNKCGVTSPKIGLAGMRYSTVELNNSAAVGKSPSSSAMVVFPVFVLFLYLMQNLDSVCFCLLDLYISQLPLIHGHFRHTHRICNFVLFLISISAFVY